MGGFCVSDDKKVICKMCKAIISQISFKIGIHEIFAAICKINFEVYEQTSSQKLSLKHTHDQMNQKTLVELFDKLKKRKGDDPKWMISSSKYLSPSLTELLCFFVFEPAVIKSNNLGFLTRLSFSSSVLVLLLFILCAGTATVFFALPKPTRDMHLY